jgi:hypothetical protein
LGKVVECRPVNPIGGLVEWVKKVVVQPKDNILSETEFNFSAVDMSYAIPIIFSMHNQEFLTLFEQDNFLLRFTKIIVFHYVILD